MVSFLFCRCNNLLFLGGAVKTPMLFVKEFTFTVLEDALGLYQYFGGVLW